MGDEALRFGRPGLDAFEASPAGYRAELRPGDFEAIKFVEAMASVLTLRRDPVLEGLLAAWAKTLSEGQAASGYWEFGWPPGTDRAKRWQPCWWSHEDYALGHYLESAIAYLEATGERNLYESALRAVDNMASERLPPRRRKDLCDRTR